MTPREVLKQINGLGCRLSLRPGGLRLKGEGEPPPEVIALIQEHRAGLVEYLKADALAWAACEASIAAGRMTPFPTICHDQKSLSSERNRDRYRNQEKTLKPKDGAV